MNISILDQSPIAEGETPEKAFEHTRELVQMAEKWGFHRFWVAEHHSTSGLAGSSPEILMSHLASVTTSIRIGSGGVLLPQYSPYKVAENFKVLEALFPGRIDLGIGRSPGGGNTIREALTDGNKKSMSAFPRLLQEVQGFIDRSLPSDHPYASIKASPMSSSLPETWVLGLSARGARDAGRQSAGFMFGQFISPDQGVEAVRKYHSSFVPSSRQPQPVTAACVFIVCAATDEEADFLALSQDQWLLNVEKGTNTKVPAPDSVNPDSWTQEEREKVRENRRRAVIGSPAAVQKQLRELRDKLGLDELMGITNIYDFEAKKKSFQYAAGIADNL